MNVFNDSLVSIILTRRISQGFCGCEVGRPVYMTFTIKYCTPTGFLNTALLIISRSTLFSEYLILPKCSILRLASAQQSPAIAGVEPFLLKCVQIQT